MASHHVSVLVKSLLGDLISLEVDPALGLKGVTQALCDLDPEAFPNGRIKVFFAEENVTEIASDVMLGVIIMEPLRYIGCEHLTYRLRDDFLFRTRTEEYILLEYVVRDNPIFIAVRQPDPDQVVSLRFMVYAHSYPHDKPPLHIGKGQYDNDWICQRSILDKEDHVSLTDDEWVLLRASMQAELLRFPGFLRSHFVLDSYRPVICECGTKLSSYKSLPQHRKTQKHLRLVKPDAIPVVDQETFTCDCGVTMRPGNIPRHLGSRKHLDFVAAAACASGACAAACAAACADSDADASDADE